MNKLLIFIFLLIPFSSFSQLTKKELKKVQRSNDHYLKGDFEKAIHTLTPILTNHPGDGKLWEMQLSYYFEKFLKSQQMLEHFAEAIGETIVTDENGITSSVSIDINDNLDKHKLLNQCKTANYFIQNLQQSNIYLRNFLLFPSLARTVSQEAYNWFESGNQHYNSGRLDLALKDYLTALDADSNYFDCLLYTATTYIEMGNPFSALPYLKKCIKLDPNHFSAQMYLTDAFVMLKDWKNAFGQCIDAIAVMPEGDAFRKLKIIGNNLNIKVNQFWMNRSFLVQSDLSPSISSEQEPWNLYFEAKKRIEPFQENGIIAKSDFTSFKYEEEYCWNYMLEHSNHPILEKARAARSKGYLAEYVLVSLYHVDLHSQLKHLTINKESVKEYIRMFLCELN